MNFLAIYAWGILITFAFQALYETVRASVPADYNPAVMYAGVTVSSLLWPLFWLAYLLLGLVLCWARLALYLARRRLRKLGG